MKQVASLQYDVIFKKAFRDPEIFSAFARDFLNIPLDIVEVETEKSYEPPIGKVKVKFDLYAEDHKNRVIVDIQHERYPDHYHRFLHYQCAAILEQVAHSQDYHPSLQVFTLVVLTSGDKYQTDLSVIDFDPHTLDGKPLGEIPHKVLYICPKYVSEQTPEPYREWMLAINDSLDEEVEESRYSRPEILKVFDYIEKDHITPEERARMFDEHSQDALKQEEYEKGVQAGEARGLKKGEQQKAEETARSLLSISDLTDEQIARATGLSVECVQQLRIT